MPLQKQGDEVKAEIVRKNIEQLSTPTPAKEHEGVEYVVKTYFLYDERQKKQFYVISISTVKEFATLHYEISVAVQKRKNEIDISLLGLNTRQTYYFETNNAYCDLYFENLFGKQTISLIKHDGSINQFIVEYNIFKKDIRLIESTIPKQKNNRIFSTFMVVPELFTFPGE
jgi:hypothetical protein